MRSAASSDIEEAYAQRFSAAQRRAQGIFFTPAALVTTVLDRVRSRLPDNQAVAVIDPACGAGAFLTEAARLMPAAELFGVELSEASARTCRERAPKARVLIADALRGGLDQLPVPAGAFEVWVGNPPYNGTSALLRDPAALERLRTTFPSFELPRGTSLRDDYAFFLLAIAERLRTRPGVMALVTSASLLDSFLYAPVRRALLEAITLREVIELGAGVFTGARVKTCVTLWTSPRGSATPTRYQRRETAGPFAPSQLSPPTSFTPSGPDWVLRPPDRAAEELDARWRSEGEPLDVLVPLSWPGLKTRFDELLVDDDPDRLFARVDAFLNTRDLTRFADAHALTAQLPKLEALRAFVKPGTVAERGRLRRFFRYAGAAHRGGIPEHAHAWCYLDRRLIPRGDHRLRGEVDPHACPHKLVFNVRELPLAATTVDLPGCVHMHRHARFAPLYRPDGQVNLSPAALRVTSDPWAAFQAIARFINSPDVQRVWAPAYGAHRVLPVPLGALTAPA